MPVLLPLDFLPRSEEARVDTEGQVLSGEDLTAQRFREVIDYALVQRGGPGGRASQRDLAEQLGIAATMVTRYLTHRAAFDGLRATTVERLALACNLEVGAIYAWIRDGRAAAMAYQQRLQSEPVAFSPLDLAERLAALLRQQAVDPADSPLPPTPDYDCLRLALDDARAVAPALFDRLVALTKAAQTLERVRAVEELDQQDWLRLQQLLDEQPLVLQQRYGFAAVAQTAARTAQPCA